MSGIESKTRRVLFYSLLFLIFFCVFLGFFLIGIGSVKHTLGYDLVMRMYNFEDISVIDSRITSIRDLVTEEVWEQIDPYNEFRTINTYYKFQAESSNVQVIYEREGFIVYKIKNNQNIESDQLWCMYYEIDGGKISELREYKFVGTSEGVNGGFDDI